MVLAHPDHLYASSNKHYKTSFFQKIGRGIGLAGGRNGRNGKGEELACAARKKKLDRTILREKLSTRGMMRAA